MIGRLLRRVKRFGRAKRACHPLPGPTLSRGAARDLLGVGSEVRLVVGWVGALDARSGVHDLLEAIAICDDGIAVVIPALDPAHKDVLDRADALEVLHRVRVAVPSTTQDAFKTLSAVDGMLAGSDVLLVARPRNRRDRVVLRAARAGTPAGPIPMISLGQHRGTGAASWTVRPGDPGLLALLFTELAAHPALLTPSPVRHQAVAVGSQGFPADATPLVTAFRTTTTRS